MGLSSARQIELLRQMWLIRCFEEQAIRLYGEGHYRGSTHPYIGQEATAVGACAALRPTDPVLATYRGHGVCIAKGADPKRMMAEILGKETGLCKGKGGSMHLADPSIGFIGSNAVVAAHIPIAGGVALAQQLNNTHALHPVHPVPSSLVGATRDMGEALLARDAHGTGHGQAGAVVACFFGDGASCEGIFYETCNMAALWKLPLVLIVENNEFAISTHVSEAISVANIAQRAQAFGFPGVTIDGCDVDAVYETTKHAVERARNGGGPTLIEAKTIRWTRHSAVSAGGYGSGKESERWRTVDPIPRYTQHLLEQAVLASDDAARIEQEARGEIEQAVAFAIASPMPVAEQVYQDIFA